MKERHIDIERNHHIKLLIVDDSPHIRFAYKQILNQMSSIGWTLLEANTGEQGLDLCRTENPDCILLDYILPDTDGLEFLLQLKKISVTTPVIMLTGQGD